MSQIIITNNSRNIELSRQDAIQLELKLNVSSKGHELKEVGDVLFNFGSNRSDESYYTVNNYVFEFLEKLMNRKTWQDCRGL
jgi:hypothetical protein